MSHVDIEEGDKVEDLTFIIVFHISWAYSSEVSVIYSHGDCYIFSESSGMLACSAAQLISSLASSGMKIANMKITYPITIETSMDSVALLRDGDNLLFIDPYNSITLTCFPKIVSHSREGKTPISLRVRTPELINDDKAFAPTIRYSDGNVYIPDNIKKYIARIACDSEFSISHDLILSDLNTEIIKPMYLDCPKEYYIKIASISSIEKQRIVYTQFSNIIKIKSSNAARGNRLCEMKTGK